MEKATIFLVLLISFAVISSVYFVSLGQITGFFIGFGTPQEAEWWNVSWNYRARIEINTDQYSREDWPVEHYINFTDIMPSGTFDPNSTRVFEYSGSSILYEVPSQFEPADGYDASSNAFGTLVFMMNGTTNSYTNRTYYVYYDSLENGAKPEQGYSDAVNYSWNGGIAQLNNSMLIIGIDTNRGENTSGIYRVEDYFENILLTASSSARTAEYQEYSNGTYNFTFNLINNATFTSGPVRLVLEQSGEEFVIGSPSQATGEGSTVKRYYVYNTAGPQGYGTFIKVWQRVTNNAPGTITRNSTLSGSLTFDVARTFLSGSIYSQDSNTTNPFSWARASGGVIGAFELVGVINLNQTGTTNYYASNSTIMGRVGVSLDSTAIGSGSYIEQSSLVYLAPTGGAAAVSEFDDLVSRIKNPIIVTQFLPERWYVNTVPSSNETVFNRNETVLITGDLSAGDYYNLTQYVNVTLDMGTASAADDQVIILYDDGSHEDGLANDKVFSNVFQVPSNAQTGQWNINYTAYTNQTEFLNYTLYSFNVTDQLNVIVEVVNPVGLVSRTIFANIYVKNYKNVTWLAQAYTNCSYNSTNVTNITDWLNGTYTVNFTAPGVENDFYLECNAIKNNNTGYSGNYFVTEPSSLNVSIDAEPSQINVTDVGTIENDTFVTTISASNLGNGSAYNTNISLDLLAGWSANSTFEDCGDIPKASYCQKAFNITVPNGTSPGIYYVNATVNWTNPVGTFGTNNTNISVNVTPNPKLNVSQDVFNGIVGDGSNIHILNFTVLSIGNEDLQTINFTCYQGTACSDFVVNFTPSSIASMSVGSSYSVALNVTVPLSYSVGTYTGIVNVSSENGNYKNLTLNLTVATETNISIVNGPSSYNVSSLTQYSNSSFVFNTTLTNIGNGSAKYVNVSLNLPSNFSSNSSFETCGNLTRGQTCSKAFNVTVLKGMSSGAYYVNVTSNWTNPDGTLGTNVTSMLVSILENPVVNVSETALSYEVQDAMTTYIGNFTISSVGIGNLQNIGFDCYQGDVCNDFGITYTPSSVPSLAVNSNYSVAVNVTVPLSYSVGTYTGIVNVSSENGNYKNLTLNLTVATNRTWTMDPTSCERSEYPDEGTACQVTVTNLGNDMINFTITPAQGNYTTPSTTNFSVNKSSNYTFQINYNITGISQAVYGSIFTVQANHTIVNPQNMTLNVTLLPYLPPVIDFTLSSNLIKQNETIFVLANITDISNTGISSVNITVSKPDGTSNQSSMNLVSLNGNFSQWNYTYPGDLGNTSIRGVYNVTISAIDSIGNSGNLTKNFSVYTNLLVSAATLASTYLQGDTGSIYYSIRNETGSGINNINITTHIRDSNNNVSYSSFDSTNSDGTVSPMPSFTLATDAPTGTYTLYSNFSYYEESLGSTINLTRNSTFLVNQRTITVTGLFADIETAVSWYPDNIMRFGILVYNGEGRPVDPDEMTLTVYDPANNVYFSTTLASMSKQSTGYYTYSYAMAAGTSTGMYLAVVNASQSTFNTMKLRAFRVSQGGPYDVRINLFENEVPQGDYLDFELVVENKGEVSQDVFVEYRVLKDDTLYYTSSEAVYTPAVSNQSFTRNVFIYSSQPIGSYMLQAEVTYSNSVPSIIANQSFLVTTGQDFVYPPRPPSLPTSYQYGPTGSFVTTYPPAPTERISSSVLITQYNTNISLAKGLGSLESVTVENNGLNNLTNISLYLIGIPTTWFNITPEKYEEVEPNGQRIFVINFNVPKNAKVGEYDTNLIASSGIVTDQKTTNILVYESVEDLLRSQIRDLKRDYENLRIDVKIAERDGKDVTNVLLLLDEAEEQIYGAEADLDVEDPDSAMDKVQNAINLIKKAKGLLDTLQVEEEPEPFPITIALVIILVPIAIAILLRYLWKKKKLERIRPYVEPAIAKINSMRRKSGNVDKLMADREKLNRMLNVLESERKRGIISNSSYEKMKKGLEDKLKKVEKKIK